MNARRILLRGLLLVSGTVSSDLSSSSRLARAAEAVPNSPTTISFPRPTPSPERLLQNALDLEKGGRWESALAVWNQLVQLQPANPDYRQHLRDSLRFTLADRRYRDASYRSQITGMSWLESLSLYSEALEKLSTGYPDRERITPSRLFQEGLAELLRSLGSPAFRQAMIPDASAEAVGMLAEQLRETWGERRPADLRQARDWVEEIGRSFRSQLKLRRPTVIAMEFLCGACNSLDEYSSYLTPDDLVAELRAAPAVSSISQSGILRPGIGYIRIALFRDNTPQEFDSAWAEIQAASAAMPMKALIVDLRGNPGGSFQAAIELAGRFLSSGIVARTQAQSAEDARVFSTGMGMAAIDLPLVLLVDRGTASSAEVLAGAMRDRDRATIVGTPTFGKGSIQLVLRFRADTADDDRSPKIGALRLTLARVFSPSGQALTGAGIVPHVRENDPERQIELAIDQIGRMGAGSPTMNIMPR